MINLNDPKFLMNVFLGCEDVDPETLTVQRARELLAEHEMHEPSRCQRRIQARMFLVHQRERP